MPPEGSVRAAGPAAGDPELPLTRLSSPVLAARADELAQLEQAVARPPVFVAVEGEAGVGKTRLVSELAALVRAGNRPVLCGHCHAMQDPFPLGPLVDAIRSLGDGIGAMALSPLAGALRPVVPELAPRLPAALEPLGDARMERHRRWQAMVEVLGALGPALLVLEDLHWSDEATKQFLVYLASRPPAGLCVVLTARAEDPTNASPLGALAARLQSTAAVVRIRLDPLGPNDVKVMIRAILETDHVSDEFAAYLHERTAGIPLAVEEVLRLLVDRKAIVRRRGHWVRRILDEVEVPAAIRDSMLERVAALAPDARTIVEAAAVLAEPGSDRLLRAVAGLSAVRTTRGLGAAVAAGILQPAGDGYGCRHALAAQAIYDAVATPRRNALHQRAARALEDEWGQGGGGDPRLAARLALHWRKAGDGQRWVRWSEEAAALASALGDPATAATLLLDAVAAAAIDEVTRGRLALALIDSSLDSLGHGDAISAIRTVLETQELSPFLRGRLHAGLGALLHQAGEASAASVQFSLAVPDLEGEALPLAQVLMALALPWVVEGGVDEHLGWLARASGLTAALRGEAGVEAMLRGDRAAILLAVGDGAGWAEIPPPPGPGTPLRLRHERARLCTNLAINAFHLGHDARANSFVAEGLRLCDETGYPRMAPALHTAKLLLDWSQGRWEDIDGAARDILDQQPDVPSLVQVTTLLGQWALARGDVENAELHAVDAFAAAGRCGAVPTMGVAAATLSRLRLARGEPDAALEQVIEALEVVAAKNVWVWAAGVLPVTVAALVACGSVDEAEQWCERSASGLRGRDGPAARAALLVSRGIVAGATGHHEDAWARFTRGEGAWRRLGRPYEEALAAEGAGRSGLAAGASAENPERAKAVAAAQRALATFHRLGATWDEARTQRLLRQHGVAVPYARRRGRRGYGEELSPREHEVVDLAANGLSSSRIATRLFLSPRTVDHHVARALRKLGLSSRRDLVRGRDAAAGRTQKNR